jgi:hypothetical protein
MKLEVYGKATCARCSSTKGRLDQLRKREGLEDVVLLEYHDMETVDGMAEGAFNDVLKIPTVILRSAAGEALARWEGDLPPSDEVRAFFASSQTPSAEQ